jgi:hypothetical protein
MMQIFNINKYVLVKLTPAGKKHWKKYFEKYTPTSTDGTTKKFLKKYPFSEHYALCTNNRLYPGYTRFQMHELMEIFGEDVVSSSHFDTNILIDTKDLSRPKKKRNA